ncbi:hypothetical protein FB567DRAFT_57028 [Paraphoma chrysanthemicola]|uniref:DUF5071 domain-containing protein n=1 Tax=Paraphoma chrysanthemicola TaxID=798071 RepID=A0A8K0VXS3_9PLEO|nr:hypothetical protein FB567DRAFT_57028 [Paraphoma chrysanthemicola]
MMIKSALGLVSATKGAVAPPRTPAFPIRLPRPSYHHRLGHIHTTSNIHRLPIPRFTSKALSTSINRPETTLSIMSTSTIANPLLPNDKTDEAAVTHLETLPPSSWASLILIVPSTPHMNSPGPLIDSSTGLLTWLQDINWPIAYPISRLLLSLINTSTEVREGEGQILVRALKRVFCESEDWDWVHYCSTQIVCEVGDKTWVREEFGACLKGLKERVSGDVEKIVEETQSEMSTRKCD